MVKRTKDEAAREEACQLAWLTLTRITKLMEEPLLSADCECRREAKRAWVDSWSGTPLEPDASFEREK